MALRPPGSGKQAGVTPILGGLLFVGLVVVSLPTMLLLAFSMMPTVVAAVVDRTGAKHATFCVGAMNFAGVFPFLMALWAGDHSIASAMSTLSNVFSLAVIFGAAAFGWLIYMGVPPVVATFLQVIQESRIDSLRQTQRKIIEEWGEEVAKSEDNLAMEFPDDSDKKDKSASKGTKPGAAKPMPPSAAPTAGTPAPTTDKRQPNASAASG